MLMLLLQKPELSLNEETVIFVVVVFLISINIVNYGENLSVFMCKVSVTLSINMAGTVLR